MLAEILVEPSPATEGGPLPRPLTLQEKSSATSLYRVAAWICKTTPHELKGTETALSQPDCKRLNTSNLHPPFRRDRACCIDAVSVRCVVQKLQDMKHGEPFPNFDASPEQTAAMSLWSPKVADFPALTPLGRHFQKRPPPSIQAPAWDGSYWPVEFLGLVVWEASKVALARVRSHLCSYSAWTATIQTRVCPHRLRSKPTSATSRPSLRQFPEALHLSASAEDRCRAEHFPRLARQLSAKKGQSPPQRGHRCSSLRSEDERCTGLAKVRHPGVGFSWLVVTPKFLFSA